MKMDNKEKERIKRELNSLELIMNEEDIPILTKEEIEQEKQKSLEEFL